MNRLKSLPPVDADWFWKKVEVSTPDCCWPWKNYITERGYGVFTKKGTAYRAHRVALWLHSGQDCPEMSVCHTCDNGKCCNPAHLYWGTHRQNMQDKIARGRANGLKGVKNPRAKLDPQKVREIRRLAKELTTTELARRYDVDRKAVWMILQNITWKEISDENT